MAISRRGSFSQANRGTKMCIRDRGEDGTVLTAGGRVLGVTAVGGDLEEAIKKAYAACKPISFQDMHFLSLIHI